MNDSNIKLAQALFPDITGTVEELENRFPARNLPEGARVTRFAPSPTGYLHLGGLFTCLVNVLTAKKSGGRIFLRIEDTDKKREIENGVRTIIDSFAKFGIVFDEGMTGESSETGDYAPYRQSCRAEIYQTVAKQLVLNGDAYPCFCSEEELAQLRERQEGDCAQIKGYFGKYAHCRSLSLEERLEKIAAGKPWVLRLRSKGKEDGRAYFDDLIRGKIEAAENMTDAVLLKSDGIPTYHFAHAVDDHFMRTTHVIRGDEWISSVPLHIELFKTCGFKPVKYAHVAPLMKEEDGGKRKLSKRKDPEAAVSYFFEQGFPKESVLEYLFTLINSNFEDWRRANPLADRWDFPFNIKKMSPSGALFDLVKLADVSKNVISVMPARQVFEDVCEWAREYDPELCSLLERDPEYSVKIFAVDRGGSKPRKDIAKWNEVRDYVSYFFDELFVPAQLPEGMKSEDVRAILNKYAEVFDADDDKDTWFAKIKDMCPELGYTPNVKEFKQNPQAFKGHVGDISGVIRLAVTGRSNTPDLHAIMGILGKEKTAERLASYGR